MGFLDRFRTDRRAEVTLEQLLAQVAAGDPQGALTAANGKLEAIERRAGSASARYATALFEHSSFCLAVGLVQRAIESLESAAAIRGETRDDEKQRLTYLMNLGDALAYADRLDEALAVHERGLDERERFYGVEHPGYGYGLDSWADVAIALGRYEEALDAAGRALAIYDAAGHERLPVAWSLVLLAAAGKSDRCELEMPAELANAVLTAILQRVTAVAPEPLAKAVEVLERHADDPAAIKQAWIKVQHAARTRRHHALWERSLERLAAIATAEADARFGVEIDLAFGLCHGEAGEPAAAAEAYARAVARARDAGEATHLARALRNAGLFWIDTDHARGIGLMTDATTVAGADAEELARSQVALGIRVQHHGDLPHARTLLAAGLAELDPADPDAICGRSHLTAIESGQGCGCGDPGDEVRVQIERIVRERLPGDLVEAIELAPDNVAIRVTRALDEHEARLVADTVDLALATLRQRIAGTHHS